MNLMLAKIRFDGDIALTTISSCIAAILLDESMTTHSRFKIFIDIQFDFICNILTQSHLIELIREIQLMFWNEMSMQYRYTFEAIDCIFKNIHNDSRSFEDVVFCFYKYFQLFQEKFAVKLYLHVSNILHSGIIFNVYFSS